MIRARCPTDRRGPSASAGFRRFVNAVVVAATLGVSLGGGRLTFAGPSQEPVGRLTCSDPRAFHDGDTFTCGHDSGAVRVRVAGIDAPETGQGFWRVSRDLLRKRVVPGTVVDCYKVDAYERQVCRVASPAGADIPLELVQTGLAWHSRKYAFEQQPEEQERYAAAEVNARRRGLGLWSLPEPQEPGECRALRRQRLKCR